MAMNEQQGLLGPGPQAPQAGPQPAPGPQGPQPGAGPQPGGAPPGGPGGAPQIDQKRMMEAVRVASLALYDQKVFDKMIEMATQNPVPAIMNTVVQILTKVDQSIPGMIIDEVFGVGMTLVVDAADALQQGGIPVNEEQVSQALSDGITLFLQSNPQRFSQDEVQDALQRLQQGIAELPDEGGPPGPGGALGPAEGGM